MICQVPNTCHQTIVDKLEPKIFQALESLKSEGIIREYQPERAGGKGTKHPRLELRPHSRTGWGNFALELWAFLCEGKRRITIVPQAGIAMYQLKQALEDKLGKYGLDVMFNRNEKSDEEVKSKDQETSCAANELSVVSMISVQELEEDSMSQEISHNGSSASVTSDNNIHTHDQSALSVLDPNGSVWAVYELIYENVVRVRELETKIAQLKADTIEFVNSNNPIG